MRVGQVHFFLVGIVVDHVIDTLSLMDIKFENKNLATLQNSFVLTLANLYPGPAMPQAIPYRVSKMDSRYNM